MSVQIFFWLSMTLKKFFFFKFSKSIIRIVAQNGVKRQKHLDFRFKTDFAPLPWASKSIKIIKKWMKMIYMIEIRFALYYFSHFLARKKYWKKLKKKRKFQRQAKNAPTCRFLRLHLLPVILAKNRWFKCFFYPQKPSWLYYLRKIL